MQIIRVVSKGTPGKRTDNIERFYGGNPSEDGETGRILTFSPPLPHSQLPAPVTYYNICVDPLVSVCNLHSSVFGHYSIVVPHHVGLVLISVSSAAATRSPDKCLLLWLLHPALWSRLREASGGCLTRSSFFRLK